MLLSTTLASQKAITIFLGTISFSAKARKQLRKLTTERTSGRRQQCNKKTKICSRQFPVVVNKLHKCQMTWSAHDTNLMHFGLDKCPRSEQCTTSTISVFLARIQDKRVVLNFWTINTLDLQVPLRPLFTCFSLFCGHITSWLLLKSKCFSNKKSRELHCVCVFWVFCAKDCRDFRT